MSHLLISLRIIEGRIDFHRDLMQLMQRENALTGPTRDSRRSSRADFKWQVDRSPLG